MKTAPARLVEGRTLCSPGVRCPRPAPTGSRPYSSDTADKAVCVTKTGVGVRRRSAGCRACRFARLPTCATNRALNRHWRHAPTLSFKLLRSCAAPQPTSAPAFVLTCLRGMSPEMFMNSPPLRYHRHVCAFTLIELLVVIAIIAILAGLLLPALRSAKDRTYIANDLNNIRQILLSAHMFASDNNDYMPYCGWGGLPDRDCWAYSKDLAKYPGAGKNDSINFSNQVQAFKKGQLGNYLVTEKVLTCPKDFAERQSGVKLKQYIRRDIKIISYLWNGAINGYETGDARITMSKWPLSAFRPT